MGFFTKLQWKHLSVVEQMFDVTEMHLPENVKTLSVSSWGSGNDGTCGVEHVLCHLSVKSQRVIPPPPQPPTYQFTIVSAIKMQIVKRLKGKVDRVMQNVK